MERTYLQQKCFDGSLTASVHKTIVKPRVAASVGRKTISKPRLAAAMYTSKFPDVKFCVEWLIR